MISFGGGKVQKLKKKLDKAFERQRYEDAVPLLRDLEKLEPDVPRWPHKLGDMCRALGQNGEAIAAYEKAANLYSEKGFLARALAIAKIIIILDPTRIAFLEKISPEAARELHRKNRPLALSAVPDRAPKQEVAAGQQAKPQSVVVEICETPIIVGASSEWIEIDISDVEFQDRMPAIAEAEISGESPSADNLSKLPLFPLFAEVPRDALVQMVRDSELIELSDGSVVFEAGEPSDALYGIVEGSVVAKVPGVKEDNYAVLAEGDVFGESCLLRDEPRHADVAVKGRLVALKIPHEVIRRVVAAHPRVGDLLIEMLTRRLLANVLHSSQLLVELDASAKQEMAKSFEIMRVIAGTKITEAGKPSSSLFINLTGRVEIAEPETGKTAVTGHGCIFGHDSLISGEPSKISVTAQANMIVLRLPAGVFTKAVMQFPTILARISEMGAYARM